MNSADEILNSMACDLHIWQYGGEDDTKFVARVVYSAISMWIRISTLDENIFEHNENQIGVSKTHILNRCKPFLDFMIGQYPKIYEWFYPKDKRERPIGLIRERLYNAGELVDIGFNTDIALPCHSILKFNDEIRIVRGLNNKYNTNLSGIGHYLSIENNELYNFQDAWSFYGLENNESGKIFLESIKSIKWQKSDSDEWEIFDKNSKSNFSSSWVKNLKLKNNEITVYRKGINYNDYGFVKNTNSEIYYSPISQYLIDQHEVYRFMYGIKAECGNQAKGKFEVYVEDDIVMLYLFSNLPKREEDILMLLAWPVDNIYDKHKLIFPLEIWPFILKVLENLNIDLQEVK